MGASLPAVHAPPQNQISPKENLEFPALSTWPTTLKTPSTPLASGVSVPLAELTAPFCDNAHFAGGGWTEPCGLSWLREDRSPPWTRALRGLAHSGSNHAPSGTRSLLQAVSPKSYEQGSPRVVRRMPYGGSSVLMVGGERGILMLPPPAGPGLRLGLPTSGSAMLGRAAPCAWQEGGISVQTITMQAVVAMRCKSA
jgi:hypothetical protein